MQRSFQVDDGGVHVWVASGMRSDVHDRKLDQIADRMMSTPERERASSFVFERDRHAYIASRVVLRQLLGGVLGMDPSSVELEADANGKPRLKGDAVRFNLSHSGDLLLLALTRECDLGIDVECCRPLEALELSRRFFCAEEADWIESLAGNRRLAAFFRLWTLKEAYLKAIGKGLSHPLDEVPVMGLCGEGQLLRCKCLSSLPGWTWVDVPVADSYVAALCHDGGDARISIHEWKGVVA